MDNICAKSICDNLRRLHFLASLLDGVKYIQVLDETCPGLLEDALLVEQGNMRVIHDEVSVYSGLTARKYL